MADFNVTINAQVVDEYVVNASASFPADSCSTLSSEEPVGLLQDTATLTPTYYMLTSYSDVSSWKTLKIKNVVYSHPTTVYLSDTLVKIPEAGATVYSFDVTGQPLDDAIADFTVTFDSYTPVGNATITFDLAIENLASEIGSYTTVTILAEFQKCVTPPVDILLVVIQDDSCGLETSANVIVPAEGERYVILTANDAYGATSSTTAGETIVTDTLYQMIIDADDGGVPSIYSTVLIQVYNNSGLSVLIDSHQISRNHAGAIC
jgi:hypothetical protein